MCVRISWGLSGQGIQEGSSYAPMLIEWIILCRDVLYMAIGDDMTLFGIINMCVWSHLCFVPSMNYYGFSSQNKFKNHGLYVTDSIDITQGPYYEENENDKLSMLQ